MSKITLDLSYDITEKLLSAGIRNKKRLEKRAELHRMITNASVLFTMFILVILNVPQSVFLGCMLPVLFLMLLNEGI